MADRSEAQTPASTEQESTSSAKPVLKLRDGTLSLTVFSKDFESDGKTREQKFVALDRSYKRGDDRWQNTNLLHVDDLLVAAELLRLAYLKLRNPVKPVKGSE